MLPSPLAARFDPAAAITVPEVIQSSWIIAALYAVGTLACVYHLANGLWTMGITWGVWTSPEAQRKANIPCAIVGLALAVVGMGALYGMWTADLTGESGYKPEARGHQAGAWESDAGSKQAFPSWSLGTRES